MIAFVNCLVLVGYICIYKFSFVEYCWSLAWLTVLSMAWLTVLSMAWLTVCCLWRG